MLSVPLRSLILLMSIGLIDLISTAVLHAQGLIVEMNPVMRVFIDRSEWLFVAAKGSTLVLAFYVISRYIKSHPKFVHKACLWGSGAYVALWSTWFITGR